MLHTRSMKENHLFRRLYAKGKSAVSPCLAVYVRKNNLGVTRLGFTDELFDIGWEDYLARGGVCAVEWSEIVSDALEDGVLRVDIRRGVGDGQRIITITGGTDA